MYLEPISSRSALVAASKSSKRLTSDCSIRDSSPKPGDAILESTGEIDLVTMSRIFVGTVGLLAPGSPFKCWSSNLCGEKSQRYYELRPNHAMIITVWTWLDRARLRYKIEHKLFFQNTFLNSKLTLMTELKPGSGEPPEIELLPS